MPPPFISGAPMYPDRVESAQKVLRRGAGYAGPIDGKPGLGTLSAARLVLEHSSRDLDPSGIWTPEREAIAAAQVILSRDAARDLEIDGYWGPDTDAAFLAWIGAQAPALPDRSQESPRGREADLVRRFGAAGSDICTAGKVRVPWRMVLAWEPRTVVRSFLCHAQVAESAQGVFDELARIFNPAQIEALGLDQFGGCFNYRKKRGGNSLSTHAWGLAIDFDPARNRLQWGADRAHLARAEANAFWDAWAAAGWVSLGRAKNYDWMHVQAVAL